jgi:hypothetical protein
MAVRRRIVPSVFLAFSLVVIAVHGVAFRVFAARLAHNAVILGRVFT